MSNEVNAKVKQQKDDKMKIERITQVDEKTVEVFKRLMPQLTGKDEHPSLEELQRVISRMRGTSFRDRKRGGNRNPYVGFYQLPSGLKAWIEDVIVDEQARGKG